jgi:hypothetical protein
VTDSYSRILGFLDCKNNDDDDDNDNNNNNNDSSTLGQLVMLQIFVHAVTRLKICRDAVCTDLPANGCPWSLKAFAE